MVVPQARKPPLRFAAVGVDALQEGWLDASNATVIAVGTPGVSVLLMRSRLTERVFK